MKIKHMEEIIKCIHDYPEQYLSDEKIVNIDSFLGGYNVTLLMIDYNNFDRLFRSYYPKWLEKWIRENIDKAYIMNSFAWSLMIKKIVHSEEEALAMCYKTSALFFEEYKDINEEKLKNFLPDTKEQRKVIHIEEIIPWIQKRPGMYCVELTVSCLYHYLSGHLVALEYAEDVINESDKAFQNKFAS